MDGLARWRMCRPIPGNPEPQEPLSLPSVDRVNPGIEARGYCEVECKLGHDGSFRTTTLADDVDHLRKLSHVEPCPNSSKQACYKIARLLHLRQSITFGCVLRLNECNRLRQPFAPLAPAYSKGPELDFCFLRVPSRGITRELLEQPGAPSQFAIDPVPTTKASRYQMFHENEDGKCLF